MHIFRKLVHLFGKLAHIFGKLAHIFGKLVHIFARKLVSRTWKQVLTNLGPLWQLGVYNDTNPYRVMLRYYRCDTPYRAIPSHGGQRSPKNGAIPRLGLGSCGPGRLTEKEKLTEKCLGEGAKGLLDPGSKGLRKVFCTTQNCFCTGAKWGCTGARRFVLPWVQRPFAPSPKHFWEFSLFGQFPRPAASQALVLSFAQTHLCNTPFCNTSRDNCAILH